jgi:hypothetical protein
MKYVMRIKIYFIIIFYYSNFVPTRINSWLRLWVGEEKREEEKKWGA